MGTATIPATDELIPVSEAAELIGKPYPTVVGWTKQGVKGHRLQVFRDGGRLMTRPSWVASFIKKIND